MLRIKVQASYYIINENRQKTNKNVMITTLNTIKILSQFQKISKLGQTTTYCVC